MKYLFLIFIFCAVFPVFAQVDETEVAVVQRIGSRYSRCHGAKNSVYDEQKFKKLLSDENCPLPRLLKVDFSKHTVIGFRVGGDCFIRAAAAVSRREKTKTYVVRIKNIWGGCRAGGSFQGWLVIDKIPPDHKVEFVVTRVDKNAQYSEDDEFPLLSTPKNQTETLPTRAYEMRGCIQTIFEKRFVIRDNETFLKTIRNDASRERCLKDLEKIDFTKHTLVGIEINSGYCRTPAGLEYKALRNEAEKQYVVEITYIDPQGSTCRALSEYDLWLLIPKLPENYEVKFDVKAREK